jgi:UDPglucose 6-dehydrogenase
MNTSIFGAGYLGLVAGACLAEVGHSVACTDVDPDKIEKLKLGILPIWEPDSGLEALPERKVMEGRSHFTTYGAHAV